MESKNKLVELTGPSRVTVREVDVKRYLSKGYVRVTETSIEVAPDTVEGGDVPPEHERESASFGDEGI